MKIQMPQDKRKRSNVPIVVPNYNKALYLKDCIDSICNQTVKPTIYFYDDGSTDDSVNIVLGYKEFRRRRNVRIFQSTVNRGVAHVALF